MYGVILALALTAQIPADAAAKLYGPDVPESGVLTLKAASYAVSLRAQQAWTIQKIEYDGKIVAHERGFYGTVLIPKDGNWWGTGHTEGGKEIVHSLKLTVDGSDRPIAGGETVAGNKLTLRKDSTIWKFKCQAEVTVTDGQILERDPARSHGGRRPEAHVLLHALLRPEHHPVDCRVAGWPDR